MSALLRWTGIGRLVSFYKYIYFNGPGVTKFGGIGLILLIGLTHLYLAPETFSAARWVGVFFGAIFAGTLLSTLWILKGLGWGWTLGSLLSGVAVVAHVVSRAWGLPGWEEAIGEWDEPAGTVATAFELLFLSLHISIITGMNVAAPNRRDWHD